MTLDGLPAALGSSLVEERLSSRGCDALRGRGRLPCSRGDSFPSSVWRRWRELGSFFAVETREGVCRSCGKTVSLLREDDVLGGKTSCISRGGKVFSHICAQRLVKGHLLCGFAFGI